MPFIPTADEWLTLSAQLLEARPTTTRITTKYHITSRKAQQARRAKPSGGDTDTPMPDAGAAAAASAPAAKPPRATLILKTFCPHSGVCLKYKTCKAAEVGRLVQMLGSLGRTMSGLPANNKALLSAAAEDEALAAARTATPPPAGAAAGAGAAGAGTGAAGAAASGEGAGKGKKKKKGKR